MNVNKDQLIKAINETETNSIDVKGTSIGLFNAYAAIGYLEASGKEDVEFSNPCPCIPGAPCFPKCTEGD